MKIMNDKIKISIILIHDIIVEANMDYPGSELMDIHSQNVTMQDPDTVI